MADQDFLLRPTQVRTRFAVEADSVLLHSMALISMVEHTSGMDAWVVNTALKLTSEQKRNQHIVMDVVFHALEPGKNRSFAAYQAALAAVDPVIMRDRALSWMEEKSSFPGYDALLQDVDVLIDFMSQVYADKTEKEHLFDEAHWRAMHTYLNDPVALHQLVVTHLQEMWDQHLADEWTRVEPMLQESVAAFQQIDYTGLTRAEIIEAVTGRDFRGHDHFLEKMNANPTMILIPSPHVGPYVGWFPSESTGEIRILFGARLPAGSGIKSPALSRSELLVRLNALADDTRLRMMELLVTETELCAQDFITQLDLSQSSASRHLRQLTASGYLIERRKDIAKCYSLNHERIDDTIEALRRMLNS